MKNFFMAILSVYKRVKVFFDHCSSIGNFCSISRNVQIGLVNHALDHISTSSFFYKKEKGWVNHSTYFERIPDKKVKMGHDILISANVIILEGVSIGNGSVIGAGAVIIEDVPPFAIVVGIPGKIIKYCFDKSIINKLQLSKWWDLSKEELLNYKDSFNCPAKFYDQLIRKNNE